MIQSILSVIFYLLFGVFALYSLLAIYALMRFGKSKTLSLVISLLYLVISFSLFATALINLNSL